MSLMAESMEYLEVNIFLSPFTLVSSEDYKWVNALNLE